MTSAVPATIPRAIVTGANTGLGLASSRALIAAGIPVTLAVRSTERGEAAAASLRAFAPGADLIVRALDLADLASVRRFAEATIEPVRILMCNAGVMLVPEQTLTADGHEMHWGVNHLGHYLLAGLLLPTMTLDARVVSISSIAHRSAGRLDRGCGLGTDYTPGGAYGQSKLSTLMFSLELDRRLRAAGSTVKAVAAHPGWSATDERAPRARGDAPGLGLVFARRISQLLGSSADHGALSQVHAAISQDVRGGQFWGPRLLIRGEPHLASPAAAARCPDDAAFLFDLSAALTGTSILA